MTGFLVAMALFGAIAAATSAATRAGADDELALDAGPRRLPNPGARDLHAVTGALGRAHVPSWR